MLFKEEEPSVLMLEGDGIDKKKCGCATDNTADMYTKD